MIRRMSRTRAVRRLLSSALFTLLIALPAANLRAVERLQRRFGVDEGLPFSEIFSLAQDSRGFIWIATFGRLFRYDGIEMRPWPRSSPGAFNGWVVAGPNGEVLVTDHLFRLYRVGAEELDPVAGPDGSQAVVGWPPAWDGAGQLWIVSGGRIVIRSPEGTWRDYPLSRIGTETPRGVDSCEDGSMLVTTTGGLWRVSADLAAVRLAALPNVGRALLRPDGSAAVLMQDGRVLEIRDGVVRQLYDNDFRPIGIVQRGGTLWVSYDVGLAVLRPGEPPEWLGEAEDVPGGGVMLVDREGSLWLGTFRGLRQFPAPDTVAFGSAARRLARTTEGIWVDSWAGLELMRREGTSYRTESIPNTITSAVCVGSDEALWAAARDRFLERRDGRFIEHPRPGLRWARDCAEGADGRVWMTTNLGLIVAEPDRVSTRGSVLHDVAWPTGMKGDTGGEVVVEEPTGRVWVAENERICRSDARTILGGGSRDWSCTTMKGSGGVADLEPLASGALWAATLHGGVERYEPAADRWEAMPGSLQLPTTLVRRLRRSPSGGVWIISFGTIVRVVERPDTAEGWEIVERPAAWHGLMINDAEDILEDDSCDLWITTLAGVVHVPRDVRHSIPDPPRVELVDVLQDSARLDARGDLELPWRRNRIELRFAALSYRDPGRLRYQVRLHADDPWRDALGPPSFRFVDLPPGTYHAEVRASLDGVRWSETPAGLSFTVLPPFWRTWWFLSLALAALGAMAYALYRYRVAQLITLERMRTRIASDLHDDIGSSLSRIAIQSELIRRPGALRPEDSERLLTAIGDSARSLVDSMSDIVWSIDPSRDDLASLVSRVRQFSLDMLEPLGVTLALAVPDRALRVRLAPGLRRHLFLFLKEAVHNVAKHAACRNAAITLSVEGNRLSVEVRDDGRGFDGAAASAAAAPGSRRTRGGHGLPSMRARAGQIGGTLRVTSSPGGGTALSLTCPIERAGA
jgi:signal transduction histidine kinase/ligand-binding sensor domain-containing protein